MMERISLTWNLSVVMAGLVPAIHVWTAARKTWMPGTSPGMTQYHRNVL
jgi:hypothetical protein